MTLQRLADRLEHLVMRLCAFALPLQQLPGFTTGTALLLGVCSIFFFHGTKHAIAR